MFGYPFMMPQQEQPRRSFLADIEDNIKAMEVLKRAFKEVDNNDKKKEPPKKNPGDMLLTAMFFTFATPVVMGVYGWFMLTLFVDALAKIKGLH